MDNLRTALDKFMRVINVIILSILVLLIVWQVITRYLLGQPSVWSEELASYGFAWATMLGATYVFGKREHMNVDFMTVKFSLKTQKILAIVSESLILVFALTILIYGGIQSTLLTIQQLSPSLPVTMGYLYSVIPISGIFISIYSILNIYDLVHAKDVDEIVDEDEVLSSTDYEEEEA